jgi:hypothetical protein
MVQAPARESQAGSHVLQLEIGKFLNDLRSRLAGGQEIKHVDDPNAHASHTWPTPTLIRVHRDAIHEFDGLTHSKLSKG